MILLEIIDIDYVFKMESICYLVPANCLWYISPSTFLRCFDVVRV